MASNFQWQVTAEQVGDDTVVNFVGVQHRHEGPIGEQLTQIVDEQSRGDLYLDFANVKYLTSMELSRLISLYRKLKDQGRRIVLCNASPEVVEIFQITH